MESPHGGSSLHLKQDEDEGHKKEAKENENVSETEGDDDGVTGHQDEGHGDPHELPHGALATP